MEHVDLTDKEGARRGINEDLTAGRTTTGTTMTTTTIQTNPHSIIDTTRQTIRLKPLMASDTKDLKIMTDMIMRCHGLGLEGRNGLKTIRTTSLGTVESIAYVVFVTHAMTYPSLEDQAADLAVRIATDHPFPDGNKRTAVLAAITLLDAYGRPVACSNAAVVSAALAASRGDAEAVKQDICSFARPTVPTVLE